MGEEDISKEQRDELQNNPSEKCYVSFALLGLFFTNIYEKIKSTQQVEWKESEFNLGTSCYYIYFKLKRDADVEEARQELDGIMGEFQDKLYQWQDFFYGVKLNIKNIFFELQDDYSKNIRHCDFDASVPRLIQLLTGTNIYCHKYSFVRELIQNAIDALSFREKQNGEQEFQKQIFVELGCDGEQKKYFKIRDYGIGMKQEIIIRYFTTLGKSYYKEYAGRKNINYNSVSNFGIGFLSVFKPCSKIIIKTKHFNENKYYRMEINSNQGHYTMSADLQADYLPGTEITCYFQEKKVDEREIVDYIKEIMVDIKYDIKIKCGNGHEEEVGKRQVRQSKYHNVVFVPFDEDKKSGEGVEDENAMHWQDKLRESMAAFRHGILIRPEQRKNAGIDILCAGILLRNASLEDVFGNNIERLQFMRVTINFPPNWLDIDVSREKVNGICEKAIGNLREFRENICKELREQVREVYENDKEIKLGFFKEASMLLQVFAQRGEESENRNVWKLKVQFFDGKIKFQISNEVKEEISDYLFQQWLMKMEPVYDDAIRERDHKTLKLYFESLSHDEVAVIYQLSQMDDDIFADYQTPIVQKELEKIREVLQKFGLDVEEVENKRIPLVLAVILCKIEEAKKEDDNEYDEKLYKLIETAVWNCTVRDSEKKTVLCFLLVMMTGNREE